MQTTRAFLKFPWAFESQRTRRSDKCSLYFASVGQLVLVELCLRGRLGYLGSFPLTVAVLKGVLLRG